MTDKIQRPRYSTEVRERAVRMVEEHRADHASQWAAFVSISGKIGCSPQTLHNWVAQAERDSGKRAGPSTDERERISEEIETFNLDAPPDEEGDEFKEGRLIIRRQAFLLSTASLGANFVPGSKTERGSKEGLAKPNTKLSSSC